MSARGETAIRFDAIHKRYPDGAVALDGLSLTVPRGQFCVILGPSGAGKSTLLRMVNGLAIPSAGYIEVEGERIGPRTLPRLRRRIGMIHQQFNLVPRASVAANVIAGALPAVSMLRALTGLFPAELRARACALIADVGLEETHLRRRADALSGGQQQRVGIARAFMLDPAIILADEPVASLDPRTSRDILTLIAREARSRGSTVLCSLHQIDLARAFADRIVALSAGRIIFDGPPEALDRAAIANIYGEIGEPGPVAIPERMAAAG
ncbi:phosphonate ABC transporter [Sphingomonas oleivorans]|uniref:Phosphonate ABC transporter n=1 Tax=Sphingomonas oleivorans TaxID=1735121 RepID=A0A2T5FV76_9SPHN|nr:phosphonate ABC transporter ATP-binding protein [Sphingomonas oleivorans]PTQ08865.1 phosphonate ABC transporter [Sphingomonas oleivorans]